MNVHRNLRGVFVADAGAFQASGSPAGPAASPGPAAVQTPARLPRPAAFPSGPLHRRMTYEEGLAQFILRANQTIAGTNHLSACPPARPPSFVGDAAGLLVKKDPRQEMPAGGIQFDKAGIEGAVPAQIVVPAIGAQVAVVEFRVPTRMNGAIKYIANQIVGGGWVEGTGWVIWQILADGLPVPNYDAILGSRGTTAAPGPLHPGYIRLTQGQLIQLMLKNVSLVANQVPVMGLLRGHFYSCELEEDGSSALM